MKETILVISPHYDDGILGCGGFMALAQSNDAEIKVVVITTGENELLKNKSLHVFREECIAAIEMLGINDITFLDYPDRTIPLSGPIIEDYRQIVSKFMPDYILTPSPSETHVDHLRVTRGLIKALEGYWRGHLYFYETTQPVPINTAQDVTSVMKLKRLALQSFSSKSNHFNYDENCLALVRLRGLSINAEYAEGFLVYDWDGSRQNFFENRPLISVIICANELLFLRQTLNSLINQKYDQFEVVLVWFGDKAPGLSEFDYLDLRFIKGSTKHAQNLNIGIDDAKGEYITFLGQTDILFPDHLELLLSQIHGNNECDIVYSNYNKVICEIRKNSSHVLHGERALKHPYQPGQFTHENGISVNAFLFRNIVFRSHRFKKNRKTNADWKMLTELEMAGYSFIHFDNTTYEHRLFDVNDSQVDFRPQEGPSKTVEGTINRPMQETHFFSIILPVYNTSAGILNETLLSIRNQTYTGWELCLVDDASEKTETIELLSCLQKDDHFTKKLHYIRREKRGGIVNAMADAIANARLPYLVFVDHDDLLHKDALLELALVLKTEKMYSLLYTDSRTIDLTGKPMRISHKPDWSPENLVHCNYINHLTVIQRSVYGRIGGFRHAYEGAQDLDLLLHLSTVLRDGDVRHIDKPLYDWRATSESVAYSGQTKPYVFKAARKAVADHLTQKGLKNVRVKKNPKGIGFYCHWQIQEQDITIIISAKDDLPRLKTCINGLFEKTNYPNLLVTVIFNDSSSPEMQDYLDILSKEERIRVTSPDGPLNWSAMKNKAVKESHTPYLIFLDYDVEVRESNWLSNMSKYLLLDGVGAVGATLSYTDGTLQHNGIQTGEEFIAANITTLGERGVLSATRNVSAVTGACLLIKRETFDLAGGFNEALPNLYNDVDFCLSIRNKGLRIIQASDAQLIHHETVTRGLLDSQEKKAEWKNSSKLMKEKWGKKLQEKYMASNEVFSQFTRILHVS